MEVKPHDQYLVKVDGSGRVTLRNRQFLRHIQGLADSNLPTTTPVPYSYPQQPTKSNNYPGTKTAEIDPRYNQQVTTDENPTSTYRDTKLASPQTAQESTTQTPCAPSPDTHPDVPTSPQDEPIQDPQPQLPPRICTPPASTPMRPHRERRQPAYLKDYVME